MSGNWTAVSWRQVPPDVRDEINKRKVGDLRSREKGRVTELEDQRKGNTVEGKDLNDALRTMFK